MASPPIMSNVLSERFAGRRLAKRESKDYASRKARSWSHPDTSNVLSERVGRRRRANCESKGQSRQVAA
jgi:hypothetical protein